MSNATQARNAGPVSRGWNYADVWEAVAEALPGATAQIHGDRRADWHAFDRSADGIADHLLGAGLARHDKVALYLYNTPEYLESAFAVMKAGLVPVNTNYRYRHDELHYLWDNADAAAVVFDGEFTGNVEALRARCPRVKLWLHVARGRFACPAWASSYEEAAATATRRAAPPWERSGDDPIFIYTGGTTGRPKGVMWRQHDLYLASNVTDDPEEVDLDSVRRRLGASASRPVGLPAAPLMHGTGFVFAATILNRGGTVVTLPGQRFDAARLLDAVVLHGVTDLSIVGDAFCRPIVDVLDAAPGRYDLARLKVVSSSGMMWSKDVKARLLAHAPQLVMIDFLNSSEASGMGRSITSSRTPAKGARFELGRDAFVIDDDGRPIAPGSGRVGRVAVRGRVPLGYYKDPEKTAATFPVIDGVRCAVPGDHATVEADGTITLLGRGSVSINTGGEKVYPEEVEEAIKTCAGVIDAVVVGVPDPRLGQVVAALVAGSPADAETVRAHVRERLAGYKVPRHVLVADSVERMPTGKADYAAVRARVDAWLATNGRPAMTGATEASPHLIVEKHDGIAYVTLNRPEKRNAFSPEMLVRLCDAWRDIAADPAIRVVLLTGAGSVAFSSGGDLGSVIPLMMRTRNPVGEWEERFAADRKQLGAAILRNATFYKPIVCAINGHAHGGGAEFVLSTDIRVMSSEATFALTEVRRGLIAGGGSLARLARQVPWAHAMELALVGEPISAGHALSIGLVNRVVPPGEVLRTAEAFAQKLSLGAPIALMKSKETIVRSSGRPLDEAFAIESQCTKENAASDDAKEGPRAFMEKRPPVFTGRLPKP